MILPDYWLQRPNAETGGEITRSFDQLLETTLAQGVNALIQYRLPAPKWQFLCYLADQYGLALHGSGNANIDLFEPRQSNDLADFGRQKAIYAAADGIWAMFFAIVDRDRYDMSVSNACIRLVDAQGTTSGPYYVFSVSQKVLPLQPWRSGTVYLLPKATFTTQPPIPFGASQVHVAQLASLSPVQPLARLSVAPTDFPFLAQIRSHDDQRLQELANALLTGASWPGES